MIQRFAYVRPGRVIGERFFIYCLLLCIFALAFCSHLYAASGTITTFDVPGATSTYPGSINPAGAITGYYVGTDNQNHGFLRAADGAITTFDAPGAVSTTPTGINPAGAITGYYISSGDNQ